MLGMIAMIVFFLTVALISYQTDPDQASLRKSFLIACIYTSIALVCITECLSYLGILASNYLMKAWSLAYCFLVLQILSRTSVRQKLTLNYSCLRWLSSVFESRLIAESRLVRIAQIVCVLTVLAIASMTLVASFIAPPNTHDSMTYHMSRVAHWIANQSLAHYPTSISRQLDQPPFTGFVILNFQILTNSDYLANLVQWMSFLGSLIGVSLIAKHLGGNHITQLFAVFFCATIPMGILQASSTQTDYAVSFWLVCYVYFLMVWAELPKRIFNLVTLSCALGLALLTKGTAYIYVFPVSLLGLMLFLQQWSKEKWKYLAYALIIGPLIAFLTNISHWIRNISVFGLGHPLGVSGSITLTYNLNPQLYLSNIIKNSTLHLVSPIDYINQYVQMGLKTIHALLGVDLSAPETTFVFFPEFQFPVFGFVFNEDISGNFLHFFLLNLSLIYVFSRNKSDPRRAFYYSLSVVGLILIYNFFIAWQPWASRLHLPIFVLSSPLIALFFHSLSIHHNRIM